MASIPTPVSEAEKLIWSVLQAEQPTFRCLYHCSIGFMTALKQVDKYDNCIIYALFLFRDFVVSCMANLSSRQTLFSSRSIKVDRFF